MWSNSMNNWVTISLFAGNISYFDQDDQYGLKGFVDTVSSISTKISSWYHAFVVIFFTVNREKVYKITLVLYKVSTDGQTANLRMNPKVINASGIVDTMVDDGLKNQDNFGRWMNYAMTESPSVIIDPTVKAPSGYNHQSHSLQQIFTITDVSPSWASSREETKVHFI